MRMAILSVKVVTSEGIARVPSYGSDSNSKSNSKSNPSPAKGRPQSPKPGQQSTFGANAQCPLCERYGHIVIQCPFFRENPEAQRLYNQMIRVVAKPPAKSGDRLKTHVNSIRYLSEQLESTGLDSDYEDEGLKYFCAMRVCKLNHSLSQVMLDNGANAFLFNDASVFSQLRNEPQALRPFKDSVSITVDGVGSVSGLGQAYFDRGSHNIVSHGGLEDVGWYVDAVKRGNITTQYIVRSPLASIDDVLIFKRRDRTYWCHAPTFFDYLRRFNPQDCPTGSISSVDSLEPRYGLRSRSLSPRSRAALQPARVRHSAGISSSATTPAASPGPTPRRKVTFSLDSDSESERDVPPKRRATVRRPRSRAVASNRYDSLRISSDSDVSLESDSANDLPALVPDSDSEDDVPPLVVDSSESEADVPIVIRKRHSGGISPPPSSRSSPPPVVSELHPTAEQLGGTTMLQPTPQPAQLLDNDLGYSPSRNSKAKQLAQSYGVSQVAFDRALQVLLYHSACGHKSLEKIKEELLSGAITDLADITAKDVQTCIDLFGPCPHCLAGKMKSQKQRSNSIPSDALPGQHWEIDLMFTYFANSPQKHPIIIMVDLVTGYLVAIPLPSKGAADIDKAGMAFKRLLMASFPKALESQTISLYSDHEKALNSMAAHVHGAKSLMETPSHWRSREHSRTLYWRYQGTHGSSTPRFEDRKRH